MHLKNYIVWLIYMVAVAASVSLAFNIDATTQHTVTEQYFIQHKVLRPMSEDIRRVPTASAQLNGCEEMRNSDLDRTHVCIVTPDISLTDTTLPVKHFGLSIVETSRPSELTVCRPSAVYGCHNNSCPKNVCYKMGNRQQISSSGFQESTNKTVELVFLFDGSRSMTEAEFNKNKEFIVEIMNSLKNTSIKFAAVQFSTDYNKVFDFKDFEAGAAIDKLMKEPHMKSLTLTHRALEYVLYHIFENPEAGASPDAAKVLVLITDGDPSDYDRNGIVKKYDEKNIIRFVIGVRDARLDKFRIIASEPKDKNAFKIEDYHGLTGILEIFARKVKAVNAEAEQMNEMSPSGFSAVFYKDSLVLGSVTSNSWRSSLQELRENKKTQVADPDMQIDSYIGYSVSTGVKNGHSLYFTGAPSFENTGQVVLFIYNGGNWTVSQTINDDQIGSYFGAELCSLDVNSDSDTDFLLVGAPLFYQPQEGKEGRIYIYTLTDEIRLRSELQVLAPSKGRFGSTISSLSDLNGDGLRDVAVGAPLEDDNRGAVYIFLGDRNKGIQGIYSQRITGEVIIPGIRFFGQAIDGNIDAREDGLPRIVVGSPETSVVLSVH